VAKHEHLYARSGCLRADAIRPGLPERQAAPISTASNRETLADPEYRHVLLAKPNGECNWPKPVQRLAEPTSTTSGTPPSTAAAPTSAPRTRPSLATGISDALDRRRRQGRRAGGGHGDQPEPGGRRRTTASSRFRSRRATGRGTSSNAASTQRAPANCRRRSGRHRHCSTPRFRTARTRRARSTPTIRTPTSTNKLKPFLWTQMSQPRRSTSQLPAISTLSQFCEVGTICLTGQNAR
jgi:hypothetical protein